jgi:arginyl-tRNA synthetase
MLRLPSGKMSSRTGEVITAMSVIDSVKEGARMKIKSGVLSEKQKDEIAESVALAALKFTILRQSIGGNIIFDENQALSLEGDSGPYLQYATVRGKSILKKANMNDHTTSNMPYGWQTINVERLLERFPTVVATAAREFAPHKIVQYLLDLAGEFSSYYAREQIIDQNDPTSPYKIAMTRAFVDVMTSGLHLLGIKVPEEM